MGGKSSIIMVLGFGFIMGYVSLNLNRIATTSVANTSTYYDMTAAHNLAVTGAYVGLAKVYETPTWVGTISQDLSDSVMKGTFTARMDTIGQWKARMRSVSAYSMNSSTTLRDTIDVYFDRIRENSFSMFAWMTNVETMGSGTPIYWITKDTVWGRVHSNGNMYIDGKPVFMDKATTAKGFKAGTGGNHAVFKNGYETGVAKIQFPDNLNDLVHASEVTVPRYGRKFTSEVWLSLSAGLPGTDDDGVVYVRNTRTGPIVDSVRLSDPAFNGVIVGTTIVHVQGTLDGRLSIASLTDMYIEDDVLCASSPASNPSSNDMLGLISERNVIVADNAANNDNCFIEGSIFCRLGGFRAENHDSRGISKVLGVTGSIVQDARGPVGTFSGSSITNGFSKRYRYDPRLSDPTVRPPCYPGFFAKTLAISNWWESYRVMSFQ